MTDWTRDDLPSEDHLLAVFRCGDPAKANAYERGGIIAVLDALVDHLRTSPAPSERQRRVEVDELPILRRERDAAVERVARRDEEIDLIARQCGEARAARDAAVARAEQSERDLAASRTAHQWSAEQLKWKDRAEKAAAERDGWRENAEHRSTIIEQLRARAEKADRERWVHTTPAVSHADIEKAINDSLPWMGTPSLKRAIDAVWALASGADPAVFVVRESDIAAVEVKRNEQRDWWTRSRGYGEGATTDGMRQMARIFLKDAAGSEAVARAIEAEQAVDPVQEKARELAKAGGVDFDEQEPEGVEMLIGMARHVLGQEA